LEDLQRQLADAEILARKAQAQLDQERSQLKKLVDLVNSKTEGYTDNSAAQLISALRKLASSDLSVVQSSKQAASQDNLSN
jgi:vacuolar-type H+-ATPase subunit E/Vma4